MRLTPCNQTPIALAPQRSSARRRALLSQSSLRALLLAFVLWSPLPAAQAIGTGGAWDALKAGGAVVLLRHAETTPGIGDPPGFRRGDCSTQRNLSQAGQAQARRLGDAFRDRGVRIGEVLTSAWCRCVDTAMLAFGVSEPWPAIDSFFDNAQVEAARSAEIRARIGAWRGRGTLVLVTHQVNITALTGMVPAMGEFVVLRPTAGERFTIVGRATVP